MDHASAFRISAAGMALERARLDAVAANLAAMNLPLQPGQTSAWPLRAVADSQHLAASTGTCFADHMARHSQAGVTNACEPAGLLPVPGTPRLVGLQAEPRRVRQPGHPLADARGDVAYPGVDHAAEMIELVRALRAHEANVVAFNAARVMALKALDIGGAA